MAITVSVVVPVYNVEALLSRCLDSILAQTLENIEIICVNDASPDNSIDILRRYEALHQNIIVIDLKENIRQGGARNRGIDIAQGEYLAFVDSDDYVDPTMFEKLYAKAIETNADVVSCGFLFEHSQTGETIYKSPTDFDKYYPSGEIDSAKLKHLLGNAGSIWVKIYRTQMLKDGDIRFPEHLFYEDNYFIPVCMFSVKRFEYVPEYLYHYCNNPDTITTKRNNFQGFSERLKSLRMTLVFLTANSKAIDDDFKPIHNLEMQLISNSLNMYFSTFDNIEISQLKELREFVMPIKILHVSRKYIHEASNLQILKIKIRLSLLYVSARLFKFLFYKKCRAQKRA